MNKLESGSIITPKYGSIFRPAAKDGGNRLAKMLSRAESCGRLFHEVTGKQLFICYGTLLGYVRHADFIAHDDDIDLCFLASSCGWDAAFAEFMDAVEGLRARGERIVIDSGVQFHWYLNGDALDVFMGWMDGDYLNMYYAGGELSRDRILPLQTGQLNGYEVLVPNDPKALLRLIYGEGWHIPDPNFQWRPTPEISARMRQYADAVLDVKHREGKRYWSRFYERGQRIGVPSAFAASVAAELASAPSERPWPTRNSEPCYIVDMGCGDGRDSFFFASLGHRVLGLDVVGAVIESNRASASRTQRDNIEFQETDLSAPGKLMDAIHGHAKQAPPGTNVIVYGRFLFHAVNDDEEAVILKSLAALPSGTCCYFEFRTTKDAKLTKRFPRHYRRFIDVATFVERAGEMGKLDCLYKIEGQGMAKYGDEDPFVGRVHLRHR